MATQLRTSINGNGGGHIIHDSLVRTGQLRKKEKTRRRELHCIGGHRRSKGCRSHPPAIRCSVTRHRIFTYFVPDVPISFPLSLTRLPSARFAVFAGWNCANHSTRPHRDKFRWLKSNESDVVDPGRTKAQVVIPRAVLLI